MSLTLSALSNELVMSAPKLLALTELSLGRVARTDAARVLAACAALHGSCCSLSLNVQNMPGSGAKEVCKMSGLTELQLCTTSAAVCSMQVPFVAFTGLRCLWIAGVPASALALLAHATQLTRLEWSAIEDDIDDDNADANELLVAAADSL